MSDVLGDLALDAAKRLIPPPDSNAARRRFDIAIVCALIGVTVMSAIHIAWACGYLSFIGLPGFALATDSRSMQAALVDIQKGQIISTLREAKTQVCEAQNTGNGQALSSWSNIYEEAEQKYQAITNGRRPPSMDCGELIILKTQR